MWESGKIQPFLEEETAIFDFVLCSRISGEGGHRAEAMGGSRSVATAKAEARTSRKPCIMAAEREAGKSRKDPGTYATAYYRFTEKLRQVNCKRDTKLRYVVNPRGVSSDHVCKGRLAMPSVRRENVRHATLLFCAEGVTVRTIGVEEKRG